MATQTMTNTPTMAQPMLFKMKFLRTVLYVDEITCLLFGLLLLFAAAPIAEWMGLQSATILGFDGVGFLQFIGVGLLVTAGGIFWTASQAKIDPLKVKIIIALNLGWCIASWILLITQALPLTTAGSWAVLLVSDWVLIEALAEIWGLRRLRQ
jgi:hypothetical protein